MTVRAADGRRADRVAELVAARRADAARLATVVRRRASGAVVTSESDARVAAVAWKDVTRSRDVEQCNVGDDDGGNNEIERHQMIAISTFKISVNITNIQQRKTSIRG